MKIKFGAIVVDGRNKIGGHVMSKNRSGSYMRTKVTPVNPRSPAQSNVRNLLGTLASSWRVMPANIMLAWNNAVSAWQKTDIFGDIKKPSGFNLFLKLNILAFRTGGNYVSSPPLHVALSSLGSVSLTLVEPAAFEITCSLAALAANEVLIISATPGLSPGKSFVKSEYRCITSSATLTAGVYDAFAEYNAKFGAPGTTDGLKYFVEVKVVNTVTGQAGVPLSAFYLNV